MSDALTNRHDVLLLFEVSAGNPNGDPDAGNMPRQDPFNHGIVSDVCLKRKVRNYVDQFAPAAEDERQFGIFIQQGAVLNRLIDQADGPARQASGASKGDDYEREALMWLCRRYYDVRAFGGVLSTGNKVFKGSAFGQVRGPVQITFGRSFDAFTPREIAITRCAVTKPGEKSADAGEDADAEGSGQNRTMGNKHIVPYALYAAKCYVSPVFAEKTGFTQGDLDLLFEAMLNMFEHDRSAARGEMIVRGLYDFEHVGTQHANNAGQNLREARLGCAHAHRLFEGITVALKPDRDFPQSFADYGVACAWTEDNLPPGVVLHLRHEVPAHAIRRGVSA